MLLWVLTWLIVTPLFVARPKWMKLRKTIFTAVCSLLRLQLCRLCLLSRTCFLLGLQSCVSSPISAAPFVLPLFISVSALFVRRLNARRCIV